MQENKQKITLSAREQGTFIPRKKLPSDVERGLDYVFRSGKMKDKAIWQVIDENHKYLRVLIDETEFLLDDEAFQALVDKELESL